MIACPNVALSLLLPGQTGPDEAVVAGRDALHHWWHYPWYDAKTDGLARIDVSEPWYLSWGWPDWSLPNLSGLWQMGAERCKPSLPSTPGQAGWYHGVILRPCRRGIFYLVWSTMDS